MSSNGHSPSTDPAGPAPPEPAAFRRMREARLLQARLDREAAEQRERERLAREAAKR